MSIHAVATTTESMTTRKSKGDEKDGMGSKPLGGFTAAICMIIDGEKEKKEARRERAGNGGGGQWPGLTFMRASSTETNGPHKTCHVLPPGCCCWLALIVVAMVAKSHLEIK